jgi:UDP-galactopyranose mutase
MRTVDTLVLGGGISGLSVAAESARAGQRTLVVEAEPRVGGCLASPRTAEGYWYELGAHTCYNSYVGLIELLEPRGLAARLVPRAPTKLRFLENGRIAPGANLPALMRRFGWFELALHAPRMLGAAKAGRSVREFYARIVGAGNYRDTLGPMLSAVPSQSADDFPAEMLFKSRASRRTDLPRSFTLEGGLQAAAELLASEPGLEVSAGVAATSVRARAEGGYEVALGDGTTIATTRLVLATNPSVAARLLHDAAPRAAAVVARVREATVDTMAVVLPVARVPWPITMFAVPIGDVLHSVVTRDSVPDARFRAFTFHFKPGLERDARLARMAALLGVRADELREVAERRVVLPSPVVGHERLVAELDAELAGTPLAVVGNYFDGLSIEDCVQRARTEWARLQRGA